MKQNLGRYSFSMIVKTVCARLGLRGNGAYSSVTTHDLRASMMMLLIEAGYDYVTITL